MKTIKIPAVQWTGHAQSTIDVNAFVGLPFGSCYITGSRQNADARLHIPLSGGALEAEEHDWVVKGARGEYFICKPQEFAAVYIPAWFRAARKSHSLTRK